MNVLPVIQDIFYSQHLQPQRALMLVQLDIGGILQVIFAWNAIFHARFVRMEPTLNAHLAKLDIFYR